MSEHMLRPKLEMEVFREGSGLLWMKLHWRKATFWMSTRGISDAILTRLIGLIFVVDPYLSVGLCQPY